MNKTTVTDEINDNGTIEGMLVTWADLNRITSRKCMPLSYIKNIMDDDTNKVYAWFKDDGIDVNYLLEIK